MVTTMLHSNPDNFFVLVLACPNLINYKKSFYVNIHFKQRKTKI